MSKTSARARVRTPDSEAREGLRSESDSVDAHDGQAQSARFQEVADRVDSEFDRYWKMRQALRDRFSKCRRSAVTKNPN